MRKQFLAALTAAAILPFGAWAQEPKINPPAPAAKADPDAAEASAAETAKPSHGSTVVNGRTINYTATPGTLTIRDDEGNATASMFYVAYTVDQPKGAPQRPVTFAFNGGPGSSTMWLHMGSFGPQRLDTPTVGVPATATARFGPNAESIIDKTDIVFLDAIGTGFSRPLGKAKGPDFFGVDKDIDSFTRGIVRYLTKYDRWGAPKVIIGESYGTTRAAGLAYALQNRGVSINGVVLISSILNYNARAPGVDQNYFTLLPSFAAVAWYHNRIPNKPASLEAYVDEVRRFAMGPYLMALAKGDDLSDAERRDIATKAAAYTGLKPEVFIDSNLRVSLSRFRKELLRGQQLTVGRLDARFAGTESDAGSDQPAYDAADTSLTGAYVAAANAYLYGTLGYDTKLAYRHNFYSGVGGWDYSHRAPAVPNQAAGANTAYDLAEAMRRNPTMKVLSVNGYFDLATQFGGAEYDLKHMNIGPELRKNLSFVYYPVGHMVYIETGSRQALKRDLDKFFDTAIAR
jgi:carboxypeptidase C (cathepsin A)